MTFTLSLLVAFSVVATAVSMIRLRGFGAAAPFVAFFEPAFVENHIRFVDNGGDRLLCRTPGGDRGVVEIHQWRAIELHIVKRGIGGTEERIDSLPIVGIDDASRVVDGLHDLRLGRQLHLRGDEPCRGDRPARTVVGQEPVENRRGAEGRLGKICFGIRVRDSASVPAGKLSSCVAG